MAHIPLVAGMCIQTMGCCLVPEGDNAYLSLLHQTKMQVFPKSMLACGPWTSTHFHLEAEINKPVSEFYKTGIRLETGVQGPAGGQV